MVTNQLSISLYFWALNGLWEKELFPRESMRHMFSCLEICLIHFFGQFEIVSQKFKWFATLKKKKMVEEAD